ncbi:predicted protein [Plenodomus lingam JN3]|uniref:Predicted protein n=1 Tax=Leptosphaeria maculans (strain JN3 / isolate v23.1.3 / race Av1-4-5-6-7-8) TaxID=985895 RepID=E4ZQ40_LEPMJ|nr:predicted protein [Plenodomus lingam JN3]CBX89950.1 predicted protein [Plenodomus lingam JN3]
MARVVIPMTQYWITTPSEEQLVEIEQRTNPIHDKAGLMVLRSASSRLHFLAVAFESPRCTVVEAWI